MEKCRWNQEKSGAEREVGCPLDHCPRGHHIQEREQRDRTGRIGSYYVHSDEERHDECWQDPDDQCTCTDLAENCGESFEMCESCHDAYLEEEVRAAERRAGWDASP